MSYRSWLPNLSYTDEMLRVIRVPSIDELFKDVPEELRLKRPLDVGFGRALTEPEILRVIQSLKERNAKLKYPPFLGAGAYPHYVPEAVKFLVFRSEFYTAYTPYQPEISQGLLQAMYEYQSVMAELFDMEVVNASMYDWGTSLAEAMLMAVRITGKRKVVIPEAMNPYHKEVVKTWLWGRGVEIVEAPYNRDKGTTDFSEVNASEIAAVYVQQPNFFGVLEDDPKQAVDLAKTKNAISIMGMSPLAATIFKTPGEYGFDIAVSDGQELGIPLNFGGPYAGVLATRWDGRLARQMPGRIVGETVDSEGKRAFTLILQTREQFTRREKATSNITTNETLMTIAVAAYVSLLGFRGLRELAREVFNRSHYAMERFVSVGAKRVFDSEFFEEFAIKLPRDYDSVHRDLLKRGIHGGLKLSNDEALFCVTEVHPKEAIDEVAEVIRG
ncbi:MAG: aminomethyl-transferring glycine dehydrogenase subunit GcvPA [Thermoprotei archaeon]